MPPADDDAAVRRAVLDDLRAYVRHQFALWISNPQTPHGRSAD
ncbi:hypothetical protein [Streptantibioticus ferralitis]|uniref:Uncharacterized protein n=1 Tax=Streptantibioticus ferralitis TaxID=236510 RepID=A0ABT5Z7E2_9ACTN|nr:hypothetical protein [Streptantibioticus ferralitis]MDF2259751.1 hypothetical protein [Streptantibioticus ferralitis]